MSKIIIHLHIPKCGGTSLLDVLRRNYQVTRLDNKAGWKNFGPEDAAQVEDCLSAHMPYGMHRHFARPTAYITFLRHPVDRLMSFYYYVKARRGKSIWSEAMAGIGLEEFLFNSPHLHDNELVRYIAGVRDISLPKEEKITAEHLERAKQHLSQFLFVGDMAAGYNAEIRRMGDVLGIDVGAIPHKLPTENPGRQALTKDQRQLILPQIEYDLELYRFAKGLIADSS